MAFNRINGVGGILCESLAKLRAHFIVVRSLDEIEA